MNMQPIYKRIDDYQDEMISEITKLVAIPSLPTHVSEAGLNVGEKISECLHYALSLAERLGYKTHCEENDEYGWAEVGERGPLVCIFTHLDIVPVGDNWTKDPFNVTYEDDFLYGRGVLDNKGPAVSVLYALKACCDEHTDWNCRVRVYFGTNEETGMDDVQLYIRKYGTPDYAFVPDSQFPLSYSELNTSSFDLRKNYDAKTVKGEYKLTDVSFVDHPNCVPAYSGCVVEADDELSACELAAKAEAFGKENDFDLKAEVEGKSVKLSSVGRIADHWNEPWTAKAAIGQMIMFLDTISLGEEPDTLIHFVASHVGMTTDGKLLGVDDSRETGDFSMCLSSIELDDCGLSVGIFMLFSAELRNEYVFNGIFRKTRPRKINVVVNSMGAGFLIDKHDPLLELLYKSYCEVTGNSDPIKVCGGTYAKFIPGAIPFGAIFGPEQDICHTPDEHIRVSSELMVWTKIYANALCRISEELEG